MEEDNKVLTTENTLAETPVTTPDVSPNVDQSTVPAKNSTTNSLKSLNSEELISKSKEWIDKSITDDVAKSLSCTLYTIIEAILYSPAEVITSLLFFIKSINKRVNLLLYWIIFNIILVIFNIVMYKLLGDYDITSHLLGCGLSSVIFLILYLVKQPEKNKSKIDTTELPDKDSLTEFESTSNISDDKETEQEYWFDIEKYQLPTSSDEEDEEEY